MQIYYYSEICKNYFKIVKKKKKDWNDMASNVAQYEYSNIECYASTFSNI